MVRGFRVTYKRHVLTMDDLGTLYGQNWLNDQVRRCGETGPRGGLGNNVVWGPLCGEALYPCHTLRGKWPPIFSSGDEHVRRPGHGHSP